MLTGKKKSNDFFFLANVAKKSELSALSET